MEPHQQPVVFEYEGKVYLRPIGRGFLLDDLNEPIEDVLVKAHFEPPVLTSGWSGRWRDRTELRP